MPFYEKGNVRIHYEKPAPASHYSSFPAAG